MLVAGNRSLVGQFEVGARVRDNPTLGGGVAALWVTQRRVEEGRGLLVPPSSLTLETASDCPTGDSGSIRPTNARPRPFIEAARSGLDALIQGGNLQLTGSLLTESEGLKVRDTGRLSDPSLTVDASTRKDHPPPGKASRMTAVAHDHSTKPETWRPTKQEWDAFVQRSLDELGITYDDLARQARERDFQSADALALWMTIG